MVWKLGCEVAPIVSPPMWFKWRFCVCPPFIDLWQHIHHMLLGCQDQMYMYMDMERLDRDSHVAGKCFPIFLVLSPTMSGSWLRLSVFLAVLLSAQALVHAKWDLCTPGSHGILNLTAIEFGAPNPSRGVPWTMTVKGHLNASKPITNGKTKTEVWWGWFKVCPAALSTVRSLHRIYPTPLLVEGLVRPHFFSTRVCAMPLQRHPHA